MNWSQAIAAAERCGLSVLLRKFDPKDPNALDPPIVQRVVTVASVEHAMQIVDFMSYQGARGRGAGIYYDPDGFLDAAVRDKMAILG